MAETTASLDNIHKPAPRWYRRTKRVISLLSGPTMLAVFQVWDISDKNMAKIGTIIAFLPTVLEILNAILANGEEYAKPDQ